MPGITFFEATDNDDAIRVDRYENGNPIGGFIVSMEMLKRSIDLGFNAQKYNKDWITAAFEYLKLFKL